MTEVIRTDNTNVIANACKKIADLEEENAGLRKDKEELCHSISEGGKACVYLNGQLTKAKEIICEYVRLANLEKEDTVAIWQLYHKAEQFLSEVENESNS